MSLGETISHLRKQAKLTQEEVAIQLQVTRQTISNWESDQAAPNIGKAKELSNLFHVSLDTLLDTSYEVKAVEHLSNGQKLAGLVYAILKWIAIGAVVCIVISILSMFLFSSTRTELTSTEGSVEVNEK